MSTISNLVVRLTADTKGFHAGMASAASDVRVTEGRMNRLAAGTASLGSALTRSLTVPAVVLGGVSVHMALDWEDAFLKIKALVGESGSQIERYKQSVLELGGEVGKSPKELADALYFITSAGIHGAAALDVLDASAKASAAGLGETKVVADAVTSAVNAYGPGVLSASRATDVLIASVREGKMAPEQLAASIGRVMPTAAALNVSFDQVGATIASLSRGGLKAAESVTALRSIFTTTLKPTQQMEDRLKTVGLSSSELRDSLGKNGLLPTLSMLSDRFHGNVKAMADVFGNVRGLTGVLSILGPNAAKNAQIFDNLAHSTGATAKAYADSEGASRKMKRALAQLEAAGISIGEVLLPVIADIAGGIGGLIKKFNFLPASAKKFAAWGLVVAALAGPVLYLVSGVIRLGQAIAGSRLYTILAADAQSIWNAAMGTGVVTVEANTIAAEANTIAQTANVVSTEAEVVVKEQQSIMAMAAGSALQFNTTATEANTVATGTAAATQGGFRSAMGATVSTFGGASVILTAAAAAYMGIKWASDQATEAQRALELQSAATTANLNAFQAHYDTVHNVRNVLGQGVTSATSKVTSIEIRTGGKGTKAVDDLQHKIEVLQKMAASGIDIGHAHTKHTVEDFFAMRKKVIAQLHVTGKDADIILRQMFGKKYTLKAPDVKKLTGAFRGAASATEVDLKLLLKISKTQGDRVATTFAQGMANKGEATSAKAALIAAKSLEKLKPGTKPYQQGLALAVSYAQGITSGVTNCHTAGGAIAAAVWDSVQAVNKAHSPSKVAIGHGKNAALSYAMGLTSGIPQVRKAATDVAGVGMAGMNAAVVDQVSGSGSRAMPVFDGCIFVDSTQAGVERLARLAFAGQDDIEARQGAMSS